MAGKSTQLEDTQNNDSLLKIVEANKDIINDLLRLGILKDPNNAKANEVRNHNIGKSNYSTHIIQPWSIWLDYPELTSWDHDIIKRVLRVKEEFGTDVHQSRMLDYTKIIHICTERLRQLSFCV